MQNRSRCRVKPQVGSASSEFPLAFSPHKQKRLRRVAVAIASSSPLLAMSPALQCFRTEIFIVFFTHIRGAKGISENLAQLFILV